MKRIWGGSFFNPASEASFFSATCSIAMSRSMEMGCVGHADTAGWTMSMYFCSWSGVAVGNRTLVIWTFSSCPFRLSRSTFKRASNQSTPNTGEVSPFFKYEVAALPENTLPFRLSAWG